MIHEEKTLRPAIQAAFDQGGLDGICKLVVRLLNDQHPQRPCWIPLMLSSGVLDSYQKVFRSIFQPSNRTLRVGGTEAPFAVEVVPADRSVQPLHGKQMLRLQPTLLGEQDDNLYSHAYQVLDLRSLPSDAIAGAVEVQVAASFCSSPSKTRARNYIRVFALNEPPGAATEGFWLKTEEAGVVSMMQRFEIEPGDTGWHSFSVKMPLPVSAQSLVIIFSATAPKLESSKIPMSYLDEVQVSLLTSPSTLP